jgi:coenzyme F420-reducing hydrogenase delta subunit
MTASRSQNKKGLLFYCTRLNPDSELEYEVFGSGNIVRIEIPCSGRVGVGEIMRGIAEGYEKIVILSCGEKSCLHGFGCTEAKKAYEKAIRLASVAGIDTDRFIFVEWDMENSIYNTKGLK